MNGKYIHLGTSRDSLVEALGQIVCSSVTLGEGERKVWFIISKLQHHCHLGLCRFHTGYAPGEIVASPPL